MSEYEALSVATISGFTPASRFNSASRMCRESRGVPGTTICPIAATWSFTAFSQVMPRLKW
jgi:hypothetical protein